MNKLFALFLMFFSVSSYAISLPVPDSKLIEDASIPLNPEAIFVYGNKSAGFRFAASLSPEKVRQWYRQQLPKWSLYNKYGVWMLYDGVSDKGMAEVMSVNNISITHNENLPEWHSLDKSMTTEIVIMIVK